MLENGGFLPILLIDKFGVVPAICTSLAPCKSRPCAG